MSNDELVFVKEMELLRVEIARKYKEYKQKRRPLLWYVSMAGIILFITVLGFISQVYLAPNILVDGLAL